jgi:DNA-directed RNA polymerase II subunit RPB1
VVSDAVSRTSPPSHRRFHPYQRSRTSCCQSHLPPPSMDTKRIQ